MNHSISEINPEILTAVCTICGPTTVKFRRATHKRSGFYICRTRTLEQKRRHREKHPRDHRTTKGYRFKDGRTHAEREALIELQDGQCAICQRKKPLVGDHCHKTGKPRAMLCHRCNIMIGLADDDPRILIAALEYLKRYL